MLLRLQVELLCGKAVGMPTFSVSEMQLLFAASKYALCS